MDCIQWKLLKLDSEKGISLNRDTFFRTHSYLTIRVVVYNNLIGNTGQNPDSRSVPITRLLLYNFCINVGFALNKGPCADASKAAIERNGVGMGSSRTEFGTYQIHHDLEKLIAEFLQKEDAVTFGMGFITNAGNIPAILGKGCLLLSDELNHASIILGAKLSGAKIQTFKHNNMVEFEKKLRKVSLPFMISL